MGTRMESIEQWKLTTEAAQKAVAEYRKEEERDRQAKLSQASQTEWTKVAKQIGVIAGIVIVILYAYAQSKGFKP